MNNIVKKFKSFRSNQKGMTIIELMVVVAIFVILTAITIFDYSKFKSSVSLDNLASDIALSIRKAQSYAIGARGSSNNFNYGYAIRFSTVTMPTGYTVPAGWNKHIILYKDISNNKLYDYNGNNSCGNPYYENECMEVLSISATDKIKGYKIGNNPTVRNGLLDIVFIRPNTDAYFCYRPSISNACITNSPYVTIQISNGLTGTEEKFRDITVWTTGQIGMQ